MIQEDFFKLINLLKDVDYFFISGFTVNIYTNKKRGFNDLDIVVKIKDIQKFANRLGCVARRRSIDKGTFIVDDFGFECKVGDLQVEVTSGYPPNRIKDSSFDKLFKKKVTKKYLGKLIFVAPIEEIIAYKALTFREKDRKDLILLKSKKIDLLILKEISRDLTSEKIIYNNLNSLGYKLE